MVTCNQQHLRRDGIKYMHLAQFQRRTFGVFYLNEVMVNRSFGEREFEVEFLFVGISVRMIPTKTVKTT